MQNIFAFVEPSFYGVKYVEHTKSLGYEILVIVNDKSNPEYYGYEGKYDYLIECDIKKKESIYDALKNFKNFKNLIGLLPATDYATPNTCWVAEKLGFKTMSYDSALAARNKDIARDLFYKNNVPSPKYKTVKTYKEAVDFTNMVGFPIVLKPTNAASSQFVTLIQNKEELHKEFNNIQEFNETYMGFKVRNEYLVEEYMSGQEYSIEVFLEDGCTKFLEITKKLKTNPPFFVEKGHILPIPLSNKEDFMNIAEKGSKALGINNGPLHIEVIDNEGQLKIVEINGRPAGDEITSKLIPLSFGINIFQNTIFNYLEKDLKLTKSKNDYSMNLYIFADKVGTLNNIVGVDKIKELDFVSDVNITSNTGSKVHPPKNSDDRLGYIIFTGQTYEELMKNKENIENIIEINIT